MIIPTFLGILSVWAIFYFRDIQLTAITDGIIGIASLDAIDISARSSIFRNSLLSFLGIQIFWYGLDHFSSYSDKWKSGDLFKDLKILAFAGTVGMFFLFTGNPIINSLNFLLSVALLRLLWTILSFFNKEAALNFWEALALILGLVLSLKLLPISIDHPFNDLFLIIGGVGLILLRFLKKGRISRIIISALSLLPLSAFLSFECFQIGLQRGFSIPLPVLVPIIFGILFYTLQRENKLKSHAPAFRILIPSLAIIGAIYSIYYGGIAYPQDMFELANPANSLHRLANFGELPFVNFLSSHLLSEQIPGYVYALLNGFDGSVDFLVYLRCFEMAIAAGIGYLFLNRLFNNRFLALGIVLFFPVYNILISKSFAVALIGPLLLYNFWKNQSQRHFILLFLFSIGLLFWKIDLGIANLMATIICLSVFYFGRKSKKLVRQAINVSSIGLLTGVFVFGLIEFLTEGSLLLNLEKTLSYFSAEQAHGRSAVSYNQGRLFRYHYFFFPILTIIALPYFVKKLLDSNHKHQDLLWALAILYLGIFMLINFPRGIVRHSFISGGDDFLASFIFLFVPMLAGYFVKNHWRPITFLIVASLFIHNFKYKNPERWQGFFEKSYTKLSSNQQFIDWKLKENRVIGSEKFADKHYVELKSFLDEHYPNEASNQQQTTFIDLSNHPMLYFYTQRKVPSYFNQYLQNSPNKKLQLLNIKHIQQFEIPIVVYRSIPPTWLDATDGIPNTLRYLELHNYVQNNYEPFTILDNREIWLKKDIAKPRGNFRPAHIPGEQKFDFKKLPGIFSEEEIAPTLNSKNIVGNNNFQISPQDKTNRPQYLKIKLTQASPSPKTQLDVFNIDQKCAAIKFEPGMNTEFLIPISWIDCWISTENLQFQFTPAIPIESISLLSE